MFIATVVVSMPVYLLWSFLVLAVEGSSAYAVAGAFTVAMVLVLMSVVVAPALGNVRLAE